MYCKKRCHTYNVGCHLVNESVRMIFVLAVGYARLEERDPLTVPELDDMQLLLRQMLSSNGSRERYLRTERYAATVETNVLHHQILDLDLQQNTGDRYCRRIPSAAVIN